jgi:anti-anti-sigma factor
MELTQIEETDKLVRLGLQGRMDTAGVNAIETTFAAQAVTPRKHLVLDFSGVDFMSSMGIRLLVSTAKALGRYQKKVMIYRPQETVLEIMNTAGLTDDIPAVDSDEAVQDIIT